MRTLTCSLLVLALALVTGCDRSGREAMIVFDPPIRWAESVEAFRARKDRVFRTSPDTPLLAADATPQDIVPNALKKPR